MSKKTEITVANEKVKTMSSTEIAKLVGKEHFHVARDIEVMFEQLGVDASNFGGTYKDAANRSQPCFNLPRRETEILITGYDVNRRAAVIDRWFSLESGSAKPTLAQGGAVDLPPTISRAQASIGLMILKAAAKDLKFAPSAMLGAYQRLEVMSGIKGLVPHYAVDAPASVGEGSSEVTKALGELLEQFNVGMSAIAFNRLLLQHGFLEEHERPSPSGTKKFKAVTNLEYGKNLTSPNNPRETQPHWYISKFPDLLELVIPAKLEAVS